MMIEKIINRCTKPRIIQLMPTLSYGDGVGNDALAMHKLLKQKGYRTKIYAENVDMRIPKGMAQKVTELPRLRERDVILYHFSTGTELNYELRGMPGRKVLIYHNITPADFFLPYHSFSAILCKEGRKALGELCDVPEYCLADSPYNLEELKELGYSCPMDVLPIIIPFKEYDVKPNPVVMERYQEDGYTNILFTGRISPNKKQEDVIEAFSYYQKYYNPKSRLFLVGSNKNMGVYQKRLEKFVQQLDVKNVVFTGHIPFDEILAYYHLSHLFLCLSEHEGFCIPLVEAMYFKLPIVAFASTGVTGTLGEGGILFQEKNPVEVAGMMHHVLTQPVLREEIRKHQETQLIHFSAEYSGRQFTHFIQAFLKEKGNKT